MKKHICSGVVKVYYPYVKKDLTEGQVHDLREFLDSVDMVVIMVAHDEIVENADLLEGKVVLDTRNCVDLEGIERL